MVNNVMTVTSKLTMAVMTLAKLKQTGLALTLVLPHILYVLECVLLVTTMVSMNELMAI